MLCHGLLNQFKLVVGNIRNDDREEYWILIIFILIYHVWPHPALSDFNFDKKPQSEDVLGIILFVKETLKRISEDDGSNL